MRVVCDAGPLIALAKLNHLGLLFESYEEIYDIINTGEDKCRKFVDS